MSNVDSTGTWDEMIWRDFAAEIDSGCPILKVERETNTVHPILYDWYTGRRSGVSAKTLQKLATRYKYKLRKDPT